MLCSKSAIQIIAAIALLFLSACGYGFKDYEDNITTVVEKEKTHIAYLDTLIATIADSAGVKCPNQSCAELSISPNDFNLEFTEPVQNTAKPLNIWLDIYMREYNRAWNQSDLYISIYNCNTYDCTDADKVIIHNHYYTFQRLLKPGEFTITRPDDSEIKDAKGYVSMFHFFNLKIDVEGIKINWNIQIGKTEHVEWEHFHFVPIWG